MYKKLTIGILVALLLPVLLVVIPALAAYSTTITVVTNTSFVTRDMYSVYNEQDIDGLVDAGYLTSSGLDALVELDGTPVPFMLADDRVAFASPLTSDSSTDFDFSGGNTPLSNFDITIGEGGYITTDDTGDLEPADDPFEITIDGYIDTATATGDTPILSKDGAIEIYNEATDGTISVDLNGSTELTATGVASGEHEIVLTAKQDDPSGITEDMDDDYTKAGTEASHITVTDTRATVTDVRRNEDYYLYQDFGTDYWDGDFVFNFETKWYSNNGGYYVTMLMLCNTPLENPETAYDNSHDYLAVDASNTGLAIREVYNGNYGAYESTYPPYLTWIGDDPMYCTFKRDESVGTYGRLHLYLYRDEERTELYRHIYEDLNEKEDFRYLNMIAPFDNFNCNDPDQCTMTYLWIDNVDLYAGPTVALYVDSEVEAIKPLDYNITNNSNDWILDWDTIKYLDSYNYSIDSVDMITYQPDAIIVDDTLPNEEAWGGFDGDITWGSMAGITGLASIGDDIYGDEDTQSKGAVTDPSYDSGTSVVSGAPDELPNMYDEGEVRWIIVAFIVAFIFGFVAYYKTRDLLVQAVVSGIVMAAFCGGGAFGSGWTPYWTVLVFGIEAFLYFVIRQKQYVG